MGALDDAIREHLELKRRHGASDEEIRQAEAEALGPARRVPGSGLAGETVLDEAGMPAPVEAFDHEPPPPAPGEAVADAPPPPAPGDAVADAPPPPPPGIEPEPLVASVPFERVEPAPAVEPVEPVEPSDPAAHVEPVEPAAPVEPVQPASPAHGVVEPPAS